MQKVPTPEPEEDPRFTAGLIVDVLAVLREHGYREPDGEGRHQALGRAVGELLGMVRAFEGRGQQS